MSRRVLERGLPVAVSLGVLAWLFWQVDLASLVAALDARVAAVMIPALLLFGAVTLWIEALSIHSTLTDPPASFGLGEAARIKCASYLLGVIHYTLGVGGLAVLLRRRTGLGLGEAASLVVLISSADLLIVLTAATASAAYLGIDTGGHQVALSVAVVVAFAGGLALLRMPATLGPLEPLRQLQLLAGLRELPLARLFRLLALRLFFSTCFVAGCASAFAAFQVSVAPVLMIGGILIVALVAALPIAVAGLGTSQAAFVYLFAGSAPPEKLLAMSLVLSFGMITLRAGMGLVFARELTREALDATEREAL